MNLRKLQEIAEDGGGWRTAVCEVLEAFGHNLATEQ